MTAATVTNIDDERLIRDGEAAVDAYNKDLKNARARIMPMARGLLAAKRKYPATQDFGDWLATSSYREIGSTDRAALIKIGERDSFAEKFVRTTSLISPETIWEAIRELMPTSDHRNSTYQIHKIAEEPKNTTVLPENPESPDAGKPSEPIQAKPARQKEGRLNGWPRAEEVMTIYQHPKTRSTLGRIPQASSGKQIWKLLLQAIDCGLVRQQSTVIDVLTARLLFPYGSGGRTGRFLHQYDLTKAASRNLVATDLLPRMILNKEALFSSPDDLEQTLNRIQRQQQSEQKATAVAERVSKALAALPADESEVIMFGKRMWPIVEGETIGAYDFRTLQVAVWKFTDLNTWMHRDSPLTRAINIRNSTKWDRHLIGEMLKDSGDLKYKIDRIYQIVHAIAHHMSEHPDGECKIPQTPLVLG